MFNDLIEDQQIIVYRGGRVIYEGLFGAMGEDMRDELSNGGYSYYLLADVEDADVLAIC